MYAVSIANYWIKSAVAPATLERKEFVFSTLFVHQQYQHYGHELNQLHFLFDQLPFTLHEGRNCIKIMEIAGKKLVVKRFGRITLANRVIYRCFRKSKARRAFDNANTLRKKGIHTPMPVGYLEINDRLTLRTSYFVSEYQPGQRLTHLPSCPHDTRALLDALGEYVFRLHQHGVFHRDLNPGNVLYQRDLDGQFSFSLLDNNRMRFERATSRARVKNLDRLCLPIDALAHVVQRYSELSGLDAFDIMREALCFYHIDLERRRFRAQLKMKLGWS